MFAALVTVPKLTSVLYLPERSRNRPTPPSMIAVVSDALPLTT
jgi:hypothetical protein